MLLVTNGFTHEALKTVAIDGSSHGLLAEYHADSRVAKRVMTGESQHPLAVNLE